MGTKCSSDFKKEKSCSKLNSFSAGLKTQKTLARVKNSTQKTEPNDQNTITTNNNIMLSISINPPPPLFLSATLPSSNREKFLHIEGENLDSMSNRLINEEFNEFLLKEKNISKLLSELTNMPKELLASLNEEMVLKFKKAYNGQLKKENEKIYKTLSKLFGTFLEVINMKSLDDKFLTFNKSFICFLITLHHIFKNSPSMITLNQSYFHKDCSRPVSHDKMFIEEKCFIYSKDLMQLPFWNNKTIANKIVEEILRGVFNQQKLIQTIRDDEFVETWEIDNMEIFGLESDHIAAQSKKYLLNFKSFVFND